MLQSRRKNNTRILIHRNSPFIRIKRIKRVWFIIPSSAKRRRIIKVWKRAQNVINEWKQLVCHKDATKIFSIFVGSELGKAFHDVPFEYMPDYRNKLTLKQCGIEYEHLIVKFIDEGLLPKNYLNIK